MNVMIVVQTIEFGSTPKINPKQKKKVTKSKLERNSEFMQ